MAEPGKKYVWYASYGSNMYLQRFLAYIKGSRVPGLEFEEEGCRDPSDPIDEKVMILGHKTYFARKSLRWNGSPIFLEKQSTCEIVSKPTYARMYLITEEQFDDVVAQENYLEKDASTWSSLNQARLIAQRNGEYTFNQNAWYGTLLYLGMASTTKTKTTKLVLPTNGAAVTTSLSFIHAPVAPLSPGKQLLWEEQQGEPWPVFTFTHCSDEKNTVGPPSSLYLDILVRGIYQMTGLSCVYHANDQQKEKYQHQDISFKGLAVEELVSYFMSCPGVSGYHSSAELKKIVEKALFEEDTQVVDLEADLILENNFMCGSDRGWPCF